MTTNTHLLVLSIVLASAMAAAPEAVSAQDVQAPESPEQSFELEAPASPVWFGFGTGAFTTEVHLGVRDALGEDASLRVDGFASILPGGDLAYGGAVHALWTPSSDGRLRFYMGGGLELSYAEPLFQFCIWECGPMPNGVYLGGGAVMGFEAGGPTTRFFAEVGMSVSGLVSGEGQAPTVELRPRALIGINFL